MKTLYPYQQEDVAKLKDLPYGLIASEMGTGKTFEGIALGVEWLRQVIEDTGQMLPILVICPINTFSSWYYKFKEQLPQLDICVIDRTNAESRQYFLDSLMMKSHHVYVMHWAAVNYMVEEFNKKKIIFSAVIADEVHVISNRLSKTKTELSKIKTYSKLGLSGTPCGDKPWQLWSILNWLDPVRYDSWWRFIKRYVEEEYEEKERIRKSNGEPYTDKYRVFKTPKNLEGLHASIRPFYVRHLKTEQCCLHHPNGVMEWLPEKVYEELHVELSPKQKKIYDEMEANMVAWLGELEETPLIAPIVIAQLIRLSQMTLATPVVNEDGSVDLEFPSTKFDALKEIVTQYEDKNFLVFTSSKKMAYLTANEFNRLGIPATALTGDSSIGDRNNVAKNLKNKKFRIIVAVIEAAAEGIDGLQESCDTIIFLDRSWRTIKNKQAEDRLHRGGQEKRVTIIDILADEMIDKKRQELLEFKWNNIKAILNVNQ